MSGTNQEFDELAWIDSYFARGEPLDFQQLRPVLCFALLWNLFETVACDRFANAKRIRAAADRADARGLLDRRSYEDSLAFFRDRYVDGADLGPFFGRLLLRSRDDREVIRRVLIGEARDTNNVVYALLMIAYRVRNNLFHGEKSIATLHAQTDLFRTINRLLARFIEDIERGLGERGRGGTSA